MPDARKERTDCKELGFCLEEFGFHSVGNGEPGEAFKQHPSGRQVEKE